MWITVALKALEFFLDWQKVSRARKEQFLEVVVNALKKDPTIAVERRLAYDKILADMKADAAKVPPNTDR